MKLTIELVPSTSWMNNVRAVLTAKRWDAVRGVVCDKAWNVCQICGGVGSKHPVECHEIWHYDDQNQIQKLVGMISLCPDCHMCKHIGLAQIQGRGEKALKHLMKINDLKKKEAEAYIAEAFKVWQARSQQKWTLDLSHLKEYGIDLSKLKKSK